MLLNLIVKLYLNDEIMVKLCLNDEIMVKLYLNDEIQIQSEFFGERKLNSSLNFCAILMIFG